MASALATLAAGPVWRLAGFGTGREYVCVFFSPILVGVELVVAHGTAKKKATQRWSAL